MEGNRSTSALLFALFGCVILANMQTMAAGKRKKFNDESAQVAVDETSDQFGRKEKAFSLFNIVQFENGPCASTQTIVGSNSQRNETCFTATECEDKNGMAMGNCAAGFGVCCVFIVGGSSGGKVNYNCSYIQNPDFTSPTTQAGTFTYTIKQNVCFIRLDFEAFTISGTGVTDESQGCTTDTMTIQTINEQIPTICGENRGQHMYFGIDQAATITINVGGANPSGAWDIKVSQIECKNPSAPPDGCLQYSTGLTGRIETFNFASQESHLYNQDYSHCIRTEAGFCMVRYQTCSDVNDGTGMSLQVGDATGAALHMNTVDDFCLTADFVEIAGSRPCDNQEIFPLNNKYCVAYLNAAGTNTAEGPICDRSPRFWVYIFTDALPDSGIPGVNNAIANPISRGLCVEYTQIAC